LFKPFCAWLIWDYKRGCCEKQQQTRQHKSHETARRYWDEITLQFIFKTWSQNLLCVIKFFPSWFICLLPIVNSGSIEHIPTRSSKHLSGPTQYKGCPLVVSAELSSLSRSFVHQPAAEWKEHLMCGKEDEKTQSLCVGLLFSFIPSQRQKRKTFVFTSGRLKICKNNMHFFVAHKQLLDLHILNTREKYVNTVSTPGTSCVQIYIYIYIFHFRLFAANKTTISHWNNHL